jgi:hypothetical protein
MTSPVPGSPPDGGPILEYTTDYARFSLNDIVAMVNSVDSISDEQIQNWTTASQLFVDLSQSLDTAVSNLQQHWPPVPGSAAEVFMGRLTDLVTAMKQDAWNAFWIGSSLNNITQRLADTKNKVMDVHYEYQKQQSQDPMSAIGLDGSLVGDFLNVLPGIDESWRQTLPNQARQIMTDSDRALAVTVSFMPVVQPYTPDFIDVTGTLPPVRPAPHSGGGGGGSASGVFRPAVVPPSIGGAFFPDPTGSAPTDHSDPILAGSPLPGPLPTGGGPSTSPGPAVGPVGAIPGIFGGPAGFTGRLPGAGGFGPGAAAVSEPIAGSGQAARPAAASEGAAGEESALGRGVGANGIMAGGVGGRPVSGRSATRSGGRPGLWTARRRKESDRKDPWAVAHGVPAVLEPDEPTDHDPGPGVIGLDR